MTMQTGLREGLVATPHSKCQVWCLQALLTVTWVPVPLHPVPGRNEERYRDRPSKPGGHVPSLTVLGHDQLWVPLLSPLSSLVLQAPVLNTPGSHPSALI